MMTSRFNQGYGSRECPSGIRRRPDVFGGEPSLRGLLEEAASIERSRFVALVVDCCCGHDARVVLARGDASIVQLPPGTAPKLLAWTATTKRNALLPVPLRLRSWLPLSTALVVPIATPAWRVGALVASSSSLTVAHMPALKSFAADAALRLELADRKHQAWCTRQQELSHFRPRAVA